MLRIKICGITNIDDALLACELGADAIGFIFYEKSPRHITSDAAAGIVRQLPPHVARIGVFVNTAPKDIQAYLREIPLTAAQLHGDYAIPDFQQFPPRHVIAVARVSDAFTASDVHVFDRHAAAILLDTHKKGVYGGTGETFDWQAAVDAKTGGGQLANRIILAGGLNPDNAHQAAEIVQPYALDISSGVEAEPGKKNPHKLRKLFQQLGPYRQTWKAGEQPAFPMS